MNTDDYDAVTTAVLSWPAARREQLIEALDARRRGPTPKFPKPELDDFYGVGRGDGPPPSDEQVAEWIDEHRTRKYGGA